SIWLSRGKPAAVASGNSKSIYGVRAPQCSARLETRTSRHETDWAVDDWDGTGYGRKSRNPNELSASRPPLRRRDDRARSRHVWPAKEWLAFERARSHHAGAAQSAACASGRHSPRRSFRAPVGRDERREPDARSEPAPRV